MFEVADVNKDNVLTLDEFHHFTLYLVEAVSSMPFADTAQVIEKLFEKFDVNKDGILSWEEIYASVDPILTMIKTKEFSWSANEDTSAD